MSISVSEQTVVTDVGTAKVVLSDGAAIKLIDPTNLPGGSGGGGSGLTKYSSLGYMTMPGQSVSNSIADAAMVSANTVKGYFMPAGDYTGMTPAMIPSTTASAVQARFGIYALSGATLAVGSLVTDLGEINKVAGSAADLQKLTTEIGVQNAPFYLVWFVGPSAGSWKQFTTSAVTASMMQPNPAFANAMWRMGGTLTYPTPAPSTVSLLRESGPTNFVVLAPL